MSPRRSPARRFAVREGKVLRVAVGVMLNLIISTYAFHSIVLLRVTPTANRNSCRVARLVGCLPRVARFARNPGLGNRNSVRVAAAWELAAMWFVRIKMVGYGQSEYQACGLTQPKSTLLK